MGLFCIGLGAHLLSEVNTIHPSPESVLTKQGTLVGLTIHHKCPVSQISLQEYTATASNTYQLDMVSGTIANAFDISQITTVA
jgi:hypothetical protein